MERVVLDTNVIIEGIKDENSAAWQIVRSIFSSQIRLIVSHPLTREYRTILRREIVDVQYVESIEALIEMAEHVEIHNIERVVMEDHEDDKVLATATQGNAHFLITEDRHLLEFDPFEELRIMKPREFLNRKQEDGAWNDFARLIGIN